MKNTLDVFDLRAEGLRLLARSMQYEGGFSDVHTGLAHFQDLQETLRNHFAELKRNRAALERAQALENIPPTKSQGRALPATAPPPVEQSLRGETSREQYQPALNDQDVIAALLRLHHETEIESRMRERGTSPSRDTTAAPADASRELSTPPVNTAPVEKMRFSRISQTSRGIFSPILKPSSSEPSSS